MVRQTGQKSYIVKLPQSQKELAVSGDRLKPFRLQELTQFPPNQDTLGETINGPQLLAGPTEATQPGNLAADT